MRVYDLNEGFHLEEDLKQVLDRIGELFSIEFKQHGRHYTSKIYLPNGVHWASKEAIGIFNKHIPTIKSLHRDMYSLIESIGKVKGGWNTNNLKGKYPHFDNFRLINNQFKHFNQGQIKIDLIFISSLLGNKTRLDVFCQFTDQGGNISSNLYSVYIDTFLEILKDWQLVSFRE